MMIACYARKSNNKPNDSIENQFSIMQSYIESQKDLQYADILQFSDDGYSGISMERDAFQELLSKVRQREIDVVIVKDLSRLGRNYLDVCKLMDSIFPFMNVRLIAISEKYDSKYCQGGVMNLPATFKSVLNEYYALECSEKLKKSCKARIRNGKFCGSIAYGYFLSDQSVPVIDEEKAEIVREVFQQYLDGCSSLDIARALNQRGLLTNAGRKWTVGTINKMLRNEQYIGKRVSLKYSSDLKKKRKVLNDQSEWYVDDHAFPPIVEREVFDKVQQLLPNQQGQCKQNHHPMAGKLYCAGCGRSLRRNTHFTCKNSSITGEAPCFKGSLKKHILYAAVLEKVKAYIREDLSGYSAGFSFSDIAKTEAAIAELREKKAEIFDALFSGSISEQEFKSQNEAVSEQIAAMQDELMRCRKGAAFNTRYNSERPIETLRRLYNAEELSVEHMQFVKRINVFDAENFEIILHPDSPLAVLCKNMDIYEEV